MDTKTDISKVQSSCSIYLDDIPELRIDVRLKWGKRYVDENYNQDLSELEPREWRQKGEWWYYHSQEEDVIFDISDNKVYPIEVIVDTTLNFHFRIRHFIRNKTFIAVITYHPDRTFTRAAEVLKKFKFTVP